MSKELILSIQPKHLVNILNGYKTLELRKTVPKGYVGWVYIYCTKGKKDILHKYKDKYYTNHYLTFTDSVEALNSKVVARFWLDDYDDITLNRRLVSSFYLNKLKLSYEQMLDYGKGKDLYAWHIKKLEIFDTPLSLSDFYKLNLCTLRRPPQSYQYVYRKEE